MAFAKATMVGVQARISIEGPSGSGKTTTALKIAQGLVVAQKRIRGICTERGRMRLESRWCDFDLKIQDPTEMDPEHFLRSINEARDDSTGVLVIDSMSAEWNVVLQIKDKQDRKEKFTGWAKVNPRHDAVTDAILSFPGHTISCFRSKLKHEMNATTGEVAKKGMEPIARPGAEYDYDLAFSIDLEHEVSLSKPARGVFAEAFPLHWRKTKPGPELGVEILKCLEGLPAWEAPKQPETIEEVKEDAKRFAAELGTEKATIVRRGRPMTTLAQCIEVRDDLFVAVEQRRKATEILQAELDKRDGKEAAK